MVAMRIYEFSKQVNVPSKQILELLHQGGYDVKSHMSILSNEALDFLNKKFKQVQTPAVQKESKEIKRKEEKEVVVEEKQPVKIEPQAKVEVKPLPEKEKIQKPIKEIVLQPMLVSQVAQEMEKPVNDVILTLLRWGIVAPKNQLLSEEVVVKLAEFYGIKAVKALGLKPKKEEIKKVAIAGGVLQERLPIIVVLGHVDHGKTTLLDFIRKTRIAAKEKGGITQHLGAYEATTPYGNIVFLDTPGHEAFTKMRLRGVRVADIAVLVVAADDGVMPQTIEAIKHIKSLDLPIIVAVNKIDKVDISRLEVIKRQLAQHDILPEDWGGQAIIVPISAKTGKGIDQLLEMIVLQSQMMELRADVKSLAKGYILESKLEKGRGLVATLICQHGVVKIGDFFRCGNTVGRVTSLIDSYGKRVQQVGPAIPIQVAGFEYMPEVGDFFEVVSKEDYLKARSTQELKSITLATSRGTTKEGFNLIIKADTNSSKEALFDSLEKVAKRTNVDFNIIHSGIGGITESDVELAYNTDARIIGLHIKPESNALALAQKRGVTVNLFDIIYKLLEALEQEAKASTQVMETVRTKIGEAFVRRIFDIPSIGVVAGSYVKEGRFSRDGYAMIWRGNKKIGEGKITSLQREKKSVKEVHTGFECGFIVEGFRDWSIDDRVECYIETQVPKT
jgi:translation initiation factor IF-2